MINNTHGIKGEVKMLLWCDDIDYLKQFRVLYLDSDGKSPVKLLSVRRQKNMALLKLEGCNSIDDAQKLKGTVLYGDRDDAVIDDSASYIADIIGCTVIDCESLEEYGSVNDVLNYGFCDIYEIRRPDGKTALIPATAEIIAKKDINNRVIKIKKMKGLFDED